MPRYGMVVDVTKCDGCYNCFIACKDEYCEQAKPGYSAAQPMTGQDWMKIIPKERGQFPKVKQDYIAVPCMQCEAPGCMSGSDGAVYKRADGIVMIDPKKAKGQKDLVSKCPYRRIYWNEQENVAQKCTFCAHLLDDGWKEPRCVEACPTGSPALRRPGRSQQRGLQGHEGGAQPMHPEYKLGREGQVRRPAQEASSPARWSSATPTSAPWASPSPWRAAGRKDHHQADGFGDFEFEGLPDEHGLQGHGLGARATRPRSSRSRPTCPSILGT